MLANKNLRELRVAAKSGDCAAAKALCKIFGYGIVALEIREGRPWSNRVRKTIDLLTAGTGTEWEYVGPDGEIYNDLSFDPPRRPGRVREPLIDD